MDGGGLVAGEKPSRPILPMVAVIVASLAALASTIQAYVSWNNRDIQVRAIELTQIIEQCGSTLASAQALSFSASTAAIALDAKNDFTAHGQRILDDSSKMLGSIMRLHLVLSANDAQPATRSLASALDAVYRSNERLGKGLPIDGPAMREFSKTVDDFSILLQKGCAEIVKSKNTSR